MSVDIGVWRKLTYLMVFLLVLASFVAVGLWYLPLVRHNQRLRAEILRIQTEIQQEKRKQERLRAAIESVRTDSTALERLARETLGYAKPGETIVRFEASSR